MSTRLRLSGEYVHGRLARGCGKLDEGRGGGGGVAQEGERPLGGAIAAEHDLRRQLAAIEESAEALEQRGEHLLLVEHREDQRQGRSHAVADAISALTPVQLLPEDAEVVDVRIAHQRGPIRGTPDLEAVAALHRVADLP